MKLTRHNGRSGRHGAYNPRHNDRRFDLENSEHIDQAFYSEHYDDFCEAQHERNRKAGHSNRDRTTEDLWRDKKTCPEESLIQIGTMENSVSLAVLAEIADIAYEKAVEA